MPTYTCMTPDETAHLAERLGRIPLPFTVTVGPAGVRTLSQNALLHKWFGEVAKQRGDVDMIDVKGECHHQWGLPIKRRCPQFAWIWKQTGAKLPYEKQCKLLASGNLNVSSSMNKPELSEYMDAMSRDHRQRGFRLTDPDFLKYQGQAA